MVTPHNENSLCSCAFAGTTPPCLYRSTKGKKTSSDQSIDLIHYQQYHDHGREKIERSVFVSLITQIGVAASSVIRHHHHHSSPSSSSHSLYFDIFPSTNNNTSLGTQIRIGKAWFIRFWTQGGSSQSIASSTRWRRIWIGRRIIRCCRHDGNTTTQRRRRNGCFEKEC